MDHGCVAGFRVAFGKGPEKVVDFETWLLLDEEDLGVAS